MVKRKAVAVPRTFWQVGQVTVDDGRGVRNEGVGLSLRGKTAAAVQ